MEHHPVKTYREQKEEIAALYAKVRNDMPFPCEEKFDILRDMQLVNLKILETMLQDKDDDVIHQELRELFQGNDNVEAHVPVKEKPWVFKALITLSMSVGFFGLAFFWMIF